MALATRQRRWGTGETESAELPGVVCVEAGHCLLVHVDGRLNPRALAFGRLVPRDPDHTVVIVDVRPDGPIELWRAIAAILRRRRGGFRIVLGQHSRDAAVMTGQWLAEHLGRSVLVADGAVVMGAGGTLFCAAATGTGWIRFRRGRPPQRESRRFPDPGWRLPSAEAVWQPGPATVVEPLPSGVWIRPLAPAEDQRRVLISSLALRPEAIVVVLGSPRSAPVPLADVVRFTQSVPPEHQDKLRFLQYGPLDPPGDVVAGQVLADRLSRTVTCYAGMPGMNGALHLVDPDGVLGSRTYARELRYRPRAATIGNAQAPQLITYDSPLPGTAEQSPGVYRHTADAVVEIVQCGLWLRPSVAPAGADIVRMAPADPRRLMLVYDTGSRHNTERMRSLAHELISLMDPAMRRMFHVLPVAALGSMPVAELPAAAGTVVDSIPGRWSEQSSSPLPLAPEPPVVEAELPGPVLVDGVVPAVIGESWLDVPDITEVLRPAAAEAPRSSAAAGESTPAPAAFAGVSWPEADFEPCPESIDAVRSPVAEPVVPAVPTALRLEALMPDVVAAPEASPVRMQPVPATAACAAPAERGLTEERAWLRKTLSAQYDIAASTVSRMLSEVPGLRVGPAADEILADLVAVRLYLTGDRNGVDDAVRSASVGPHVPLARCVASGLRRLQSFRGATQVWACAGRPELDWYRNRTVLTEWAFLTATADGRPACPGEVEFRIWSMTGRRTSLIDPRIDDQVVFPPGTSFKVLDVRDEPTPVVLLRELSGAEVGEDGKVDGDRSMFDTLALGGLDRALAAWRRGDRRECPRPVASAPPGLLSANSRPMERASA